MKIIFTKSSKIGSKAIRWGLKEPVSHVAFVFDDRLVLHSSLGGIELQWYETFKKHNVIVMGYQNNLPLEKEEEIYKSILNAYDDCKYDYKAYFYFAWRILLKFLFNKPFPKLNAWSEPTKYLCTEMASCLPKWVLNTDGLDLGMVTPYELYKMINNNVVQSNFVSMLVVKNDAL